MASGKKKQRAKGKTFALNEFLQGEDGTAPNPVSTTTSSSWAAEMDNVDNEDGEEVRVTFDRSKLPTAPKAARGPDIDVNRISDNKPFTAFVGNLPYDVSEDKIAQFFEGRNLKVEGVRLPNDNGRQRGFGYVEFSTKEDLISALSQNEEMFNGRKLRVDLAETSGGDRERGGDGGSRSDRNDWRGGGGDPDRTEGDWRRRDPPSSFGGNDRGGDRFSDRGDRFSDRGDRAGSRGFNDRDEYRDRRGYGDRESFGDRGGGRFGDRDSDRYGGGRYDRNRDGGFDRDGDRNYDRRDGYRNYDRRDGDRDRYDRRDGDRYYDRRDSDRWRDGGRYDDRRGGGFDDRRNNRYDDRRGGDRYGGRSGYDDRGYGGRRDGYRRDDDGGRYGGNREDRGGSREGSQDAPKERPRLQLQPRTKPVEKAPSEQARQSSIFGSAKPVDTAAKEREIEEKMKKLDTNAHYTSEEVARDSYRDGRDGGRTRRDSDGGRGGGRERRLSSSSGNSRRDSETSRLSDDSHPGDRDGRANARDERKMVPAPPPKENAWSKPRSDVITKPAEPSRQWSSSSSEQDGNRRDNRRQSDEGRRSGYGRGSNQENRRQEQKRERREKQLPRSVEDMPKLDEGPVKDWTDVNKYALIGSDED